MRRIDDAKQRDIVYGEAVLELLNEKNSVTKDTLLQKLRTTLRSESKSWKIDAIHSAISDLTPSGPNKTHISTSPVLN